MTILLALCYVVTLLALLVVLGVHPQLSSHSKFELQRRIKKGDAAAGVLLKRHELLRDIFSLQRVLAALLLVLLSVLGVELFHWSIGVMVALFVALESGAVARLAPLQRRSQSLYEKYEPAVLAFIEKHPLLFRAIRSVAPTPADAYDIESKEELIEMVKQSGEVLNTSQKKLILNGLAFDQTTVASIMTPRSMMSVVARDEVVGPLVLDDLHKTGHSRFPVIDGDIDHIVGMLYLQQLLSADHRSRTYRADTAMDPQVFYIHQSQSLQQALSGFLRTRHHLFIVVNEFRETVGLLSLEDVLEALLGRRIVDENDVYDDLRKAAAANPRQNNQPQQARDVA